MWPSAGSTSSPGSPGSDRRSTSSRSINHRPLRGRPARRRTRGRRRGRGGDPRWRVLSESRSSRSRRRSCRRGSTGSSGRHTRRGSQGLALLVVVYFAHASTFLDRSGRSRDPRTWRGDRDRGRRTPAPRVVPSTTLSAAASAPAVARATAGGVLAFVALAVTWASAYPAASQCAPPTSRSERCSDDPDGRERLLRDHPEPLEARPREGGRPRSPTRCWNAARQDRARCTTTTSPCRCWWRCSRTTSRSPTATATRG